MKGSLTKKEQSDSDFSKQAGRGCGSDTLGRPRQVGDAFVFQPGRGAVGIFLTLESLESDFTCMYRRKKELGINF